MAALAIGLEPRPAQVAQTTPELVQYTQLLRMNVVELEARVAEELLANPALVAPETWTCPGCGVERTADACQTCELAAAVGCDVAAPNGAVAPADGPEREPRDEPAPADRLIALARILLPPAERPLVNAYVAALDDDGYLRLDLGDLAIALAVDPGRLEHVRIAARAAGGPAIGARDVRESLLLQLAALDPSPARSLAAVIVRDHLERLAASRLGTIATTLHVSVAQVEAARDAIRDELEPRPLAGLHDPVRQAADPIRPDVVIRSATSPGTRFSIEVVDSPRSRVELDRLHRIVASSGDATIPPDDRRQAQDRVQRGREFLARLRDRRGTLGRIAAIVAERQWAFVLYGAPFIQPLTRAEIAAETGLHESTISRAITGKHVLLPSRRIVPFADFFDATLAVQDVLRRVLAEAGRPMTDADLAAGLRERGYRLARRTVAKYRIRLGVPAASPRGARESRFA